jgi:hypothetical protein
MGRYKKTKASPKKKGRRGWTTEAQEEFLTSKISTYLASQGSKIPLRFLADIMGEVLRAVAIATHFRQRKS